MKILQINVVYIYVSSGKIVWEIHQDLISNKKDSYVLYGRGIRIIETGICKVKNEVIIKLQSLQSKLTGYAFSGCAISTLSLIRHIKDEKTDIIHIHNLNGYLFNNYRLLDFIKINFIKTVINLHAEFMYTGGCGSALDCVKWKTGCGS